MVDSKQCQEHSGMVVWIKIGCGLLGILCSLFSYSAFIQIPAFRDEIRQTQEQNEKRFIKIENELAQHKDFMQRLAYQRNLDHRGKDEFK